MAVTYHPPSTDPFSPKSNLTGPQRDAAAALVNLFNQYDLGSLAPQIINMVKQGWSSDTISIELQNTKEYKQRFAANEIRRQKGLPVLSPAEYLATERAYRQTLSSAGMPKGFYDQHDDFKNFLANDMSPDELNKRVQAWQQEAQKDQAGLDAIRKITGLGVNDYAAYLMNPDRALPLLQRTARAVSFAAAAERHGYDIAKSLAEQYGALGIEADEANKGFSTIQDIQAETDKLAKIYGLGNYSVAEAASEVFGGNAEAGQKRQKLASQERATFSDSGSGKTGRAKNSNSY